MCADGFAFGGTTSDSRILLWLIYNCIAIRSATADTFKTLWRALVWSLYWLYRGKWPTHAHDGTLYTAGLAAGGWMPLAGSCDDDFYNRPQPPTPDLIRRMWRPALKLKPSRMHVRPRIRNKFRLEPIQVYCPGDGGSASSGMRFERCSPPLSE